MTVMMTVMPMTVTLVITLTWLEKLQINPIILNN